MVVGINAARGMSLPNLVPPGRILGAGEFELRPYTFILREIFTRSYMVRN